MLTCDEGEKFPAQVETPGRTLGFWHEIKIHPGRPEWVLAKVRRNICEEWDASTNPQCAYDLFLSQVIHAFPVTHASLSFLWIRYQTCCFSLCD